MNIPTAVDRSAPVIAHHEVDIQAPLDTVWRLHTDINAWPTWQTAITAAHLDGVLAENDATIEPVLGRPPRLSAGGRSATDDLSDRTRLSACPETS